MLKKIKGVIVGGESLLYVQILNWTIANKPNLTKNVFIKSEVRIGEYFYRTFYHITIIIYDGYIKTWTMYM